ncbi:MAG: DUF805 domain-containing protein [Pseudomonadota bacterium]
MDFASAIKTVFSNYANFNDRSGRPEFWWWALAYILGSILVNAVTGGDLGFASVSAATIYYLALLVPNIAVGVRRLHDTGKSGWWLLLWFIPLIGWIVVLYFLVQPSQGSNQYGDGPLAPAK